MDRELLSASEAVAAHVNVFEVVTPIPGLMDILLITGAVFSTVMLAESDVLSPKPSVAVTEHKIVSDGDTMAGDSCREEAVPNVLLVVELVHT